MTPYKSFFYFFNIQSLFSLVSLFVVFIFLLTPNWESNNLYAQTDMWVEIWTTSSQLVEPYNNPPEPGLTNNTIRQVLLEQVENLMQSSIWIKHCVIPKAQQCYHRKPIQATTFIQVKEDTV